MAAEGNNSSSLNASGEAGILQEDNDDLTDQCILKDLESRSDIEPSDNVFDDEEGVDGMEDEEDDDPELLRELDQLKEEIIEEFYAIAIQKKHEAFEEVKADCKKNKTPKDQEKKRIQEVTASMDKKKKDGIVEVKNKLN